MVKAHVATWGIAALATACVILRPFRIPEAVWPLGAGAVLVISGLLPMSAAADGVAKGADVYCFLIGMMMLSELARREGLFDWLAAMAAVRARGSATRLFGLIYAVGTGVTVFLSNDATAVVLTPAVAAVTRAAKIQKPLPYLLICAFIANAASFVLPISNPANLVIYGKHLPPLLDWLPRFTMPSLLSIAVTYAVLRWTQRPALRQSIKCDLAVPRLSISARLTAAGIGATAVTLLLASTSGRELGIPTLIASLVVLGAVCISTYSTPRKFLHGVSWEVIPLVAGLFILVEALQRSGIVDAMSALLGAQAQYSVPQAAAGAAMAMGLASNLVNNLPAGLIAGTAVQTAHVPPLVTNAVLIGTDLGPNLSVTGSLATLLWVAALRREGVEISGWDFFKLGMWIMPCALVAAIGGLLLVG